MKFPLMILMMLVLDRNYNNPAMIGYKVWQQMPSFNEDNKFHVYFKFSVYP